MSQSLSQVYLHIIYHVKNPLVKIPDILIPELHAYTATCCSSHSSPAVIVGGIEDHVHVLSRFSRSISIAGLVEELKKSTSKWLKTKSDVCLHLSKFSWQNGYGVFSVSHSLVDTVYNYIKSQKNHHRHISAQEEFIRFLQKHKVEYKQEYLWDKAWGI